MNTIAIPKIGFRFFINSDQYEICDVTTGQIRYAAVKGGQMKFISINKFRHLLDKRVITHNDVNEYEELEELSPVNLSESEVAEMNRRLHYLRSIIATSSKPTYRKKVVPLIEKLAIEIKDENPPSFATFARWHKNFVASGKKPISMVPNNRNKGNRVIRYEPMIEQIIAKHIREDWLTNKKPTIKTVYSNIIGDIIEQYGIGDDLPDDVKFPSLHAVTQRIHKIDPYIKDAKRRGKHTANKVYRAAGKGLLPTRVLEIAQADGNHLDVLIIDEDTKEVIGRGYLTIIMDVYSRCIIAYKVTIIPFSSATLLSSLKHAVSGIQTGHGGVFEVLIVDNGSDYISFAVKNLCNHLGIQIEHGAPRDPNSKAHVERLFKTINAQLIHLIPGTTFSNIEHRGEYKSEDYACVTIKNLEELIGEWIKNIYHKSIHGGTGRAPELLWTDDIKINPVHTYPENQLDKIAREVVVKSVSNGRVRHMYLYWYSHALATIEEKLRQKKLDMNVEVYVDTLNLEKVYVKDPFNVGVFITCDSTNPEYTCNLSMYEHELVLADLKKQSDKDLSSYPDHQLEIAKYNLWKNIVDLGSKFARKQIARIKETFEKTSKAESVMKNIQKSKSSDLTPPVLPDEAASEIQNYLNDNESTATEVPEELIVEKQPKTSFEYERF